MARAATVEPTDAEMANWKQIDHAADWAALKKSEEPNKDQRGSLYDHLGIEGDDPLAVIGIVDAEAYTTSLGGVACWHSTSQPWRARQSGVARVGLSAGLWHLGSDEGGQGTGRPRNRRCQDP